MVLVDGIDGELVVALELDDADLAERFARLIADADGMRIARGNEPADVAIVRPEAPPSDLGLTPREKDVLMLLAEGASNKAIGRRLGISVHTVKFHVGSLLEKFDATGRTDAVAHAARLGVIHL